MTANCGPGTALSGLMIITDRRQLPDGRDLVSHLRACAAAGARHVIVREHDLHPQARSTLIARLADIDALTVLSSRIDDPAAAGVHLAACQPRCERWFGRSCHSAADVALAAGEGAAWVTLSPFAESRSKPGYGPPLTVRAFADHSGTHVFALGGVDAANARQARAAGADGVAVMGAVMRATDPAGTVARLLRAVA